MKRVLYAIISFIFIFSFTACSCKKEELYEVKSIVVPSVRAYLSKDINGRSTLVYPFNTTISLNYFKDDKIDEVRDYFRGEYLRLHKLFDRHYYYFDDNGSLINNLRVINESNGEVVSVDEDLIQIIKEGIRFTKLSDGKFNVGVGTLSTLWDNFIAYSNSRAYLDVSNSYSYQDGVYTLDNEGKYFKFNDEYVYVELNGEEIRYTYNEDSGYVEDASGNYIVLPSIAPTQEQITQAKLCVPSSETIEDIIVIDDINNTIKINDISGCNTSVNITLGALAKSYVAEKIANNETIKNGDFLINAGQSTIKVIGKNLSRSEGVWNIGITDSYLMYSSKTNYASYLLKISESISVSSSSGDQNNYYYNDNYYHHIIDPISGYPNQDRLAVTALCDNAMYADIITTTLMSMDMEQTLEFLDALNDEGIDFELVIQDKTETSVRVLATNNIKNMLSIRNNNESLSEYLGSLVIEDFEYDS